MLPIYVDDDRVVLQGVEKSPTKKLGKFQHLSYNFRYSYNFHHNEGIWHISTADSQPFEMLLLHLCLQF